jgi:hypothetical protein
MVSQDNLNEDERPKVVSGVRARFSESELARVVAFVRQNRAVLRRYWDDEEYYTRELLDDLLPVR